MRRAAFGAKLTVIALTATTMLARAQGVPIIDGRSLLERLAITKERSKDVTTQGQKKAHEEAKNEIDKEIIAELDKLINAGMLPQNSTHDSIKKLEAGAGENNAASDRVYSPDDKNPAAAKSFGDAALTVEQVIIAGAKATYGEAGVSAAGLSQAQWRALLQAMIWQESRFNPYIGSPVGAYGLTQLMPDTARELGVGATYRTNPYVQVMGGGRYLAKMLKNNNGNIVLALASYNAGYGNVRKHGGVPPFKETQNYVRVIPQKYNEYLAKIGGADAEGTIEPVLAAGANTAIVSGAASEYSDYTASEIASIAHRIKSIILEMKANDNPTKAWALNTYARAEMGRIMALRLRVLAVTVKQASAASIEEAVNAGIQRHYFQFSYQ